MQSSAERRWNEVNGDLHDVIAQTDHEVVGQVISQHRQVTSFELRIAHLIARTPAKHGPKFCALPISTYQTGTEVLHIVGFEETVWCQPRHIFFVEDVDAEESPDESFEEGPWVEDSVDVQIDYFGLPISIVAIAEDAHVEIYERGCSVESRLA